MLNLHFHTTIKIRLLQTPPLHYLKSIAWSYSCKGLCKNHKYNVR